MYIGITGYPQNIYSYKDMNVVTLLSTSSIGKLSICSFKLPFQKYFDQIEESGD